MKKTKKKKNSNWIAQINEAKKQLSTQKFHYKDKPVHGEPTDKQIETIRSFCRQRNLHLSIIGLDKAEASKILTYFFDKTGNEIKPNCFDKYISKKKLTL